MPDEQRPLRRRLTAVLLADVVGYSRLMSADEEGTHARITGYVTDLIEPAVRRYDGRLVRSMGDGMLFEFGSALDAVRCGLDIQQQLAESQANRPDRVQMRIGVNTGDVITDERDIYGNIVNITARLENIAQPGSVCVSQSIYDQTRGHPGLHFLDRGLRRVKNIDYPIHVFEACYRQPSLLQRLLARRRANWVAATGLLVALAAAAAPVVSELVSAEQTHSIIVLPFRNLSGDPRDDYFADAITDDLTTDLSRLPRAFVIANATAQTYKGKAVDARQIGAEVGVRYLLEGSVWRVGRTARVNVQLIDTQTGAHVWAERFTHESTTLMDLEEAVTGRIGQSLNVHLIKAVAREPVGSLAGDGNPLDERLRAMAVLTGKPTAERFLEGRRHLEAAVQQDDNSADSWAMLAWVLISEYNNGWNSAGPDHVDRAEQAHRKAHTIDPGHADAHQAAGLVRRVRGDHAGALESFEAAIKSNPNFTRAHAQRANELAFLGRTKEAVAAAKKTIRLSPKDPQIGTYYWVLGRAQFADGKYKDAVDALTRSVADRPTLWFNRAWLISALGLRGQTKEAQTALADFTTAFPNHTLARITEIYTTEDQYTKSVMIRAVAPKLFEGLQKAGLR